MGETLADLAQREKPRSRDPRPIVRIDGVMKRTLTIVRRPVRLTDA